MTPLTEQEIIRIALPFIRSHYKFRPRGEGTMDVRYNVSTKDGVIADGYLSFTSESGEPFIVTVESAALESKGEVVYQKEYPLLNWDGLALSSSLLAIGYIYANNQGINLSQKYGSIPLVLWIIGGLFIGLAIYRFLLGWLPRYRYIYAIEQFNAYHATEQWIALGKNVFGEDSLDQKYFEELKIQCVKNGVGLVIVSPSKTVNIIFTPAREPVMSNRKKVIFQSNNTIEQAIPQASGFLNKLKQFSRKIPFIGQSRSTLDLSRYRAKNYKQLFLFMAGILTMLSIFYTEWQDQPIAYLNERRFEQKQLKRAKTLEKETRAYTPENEIAVDSVVSRQYLDIETDIPSNTTTTDVITTTDNGNTVDYTCERFYNFNGELFAVQDSVFADIEAANQRRDYLKKVGFPINIVWLGCFRGKNKGYMVYYDLLYSEKDLAKVKAQEYSRSLDVYAIPHNRVRLRTIRRMQ